MLYVLHCSNHPELAYTGGQRPIVHLEADLHDVVAWASAARRPWAFSLSNAGARYAEFHNRRDTLDRIDWSRVAARDFRAPEIKETKQAEFLVQEWFPWTLVSRMGVISIDIRTQASAAIAEAQHRPRVDILPNWYY